MIEKQCIGYTHISKKKEGVTMNPTKIKKTTTTKHLQKLKILI